MRARKQFDTLKYANSLKTAGVESKAAEAIAEGQAAANEDIIASLFDSEEGWATKADLTTLKSELKSDILQVESKLEAKIADTKAELKNDISDIKIGMKALETTLTMRLGVIVLGGLGLYGALNHFFHLFSS